MSHVRSRKVQPALKAVCVLSTAVGSTQVSIPHAEMTGSATVREHCPTHEMSWTVSIFSFDITRSFALGQTDILLL